MNDQIIPETVDITKQCKKCLETKPIEQFNKQTKMKGGYSNICKSCKSILNKQRYNDPEFNRAEYIEKQKNWNKENSKKVYRYIKKSRKKNKQLLKKSIVEELSETSPDLIKEIVS